MVLVVTVVDHLILGRLIRPKLRLPRTNKMSSSSSSSSRKSTSSSSSSNSSGSGTVVNPNPPPIPGLRAYSCTSCRSHVADHNDVISTAFQGRNGRAYLLGSVNNVSVGPKEDRHLMTGLHAVADISCSQCQEVLGWKYERAYEPSQKYKEGKFVLERSKIMKECWS